MTSAYEKFEKEYRASKKHKFVAYNKLYSRATGKPLGRKYKVATGNSKAEVTRKARAYNSRWNKWETKHGKGQKYTAKLVEVKSRGTRKKRRSSGRSYYGNLFGGW